MIESAQMDIPPPEHRLCVKHNKPITPSYWRIRCRTTGCSVCVRERQRSPEARKRREKKWQTEFIGCVKHPERRCNRSVYVSTSNRRCCSCHSRLSDGIHKPGHKRRQRKNAYKKIVRGRTHYYSNGMRGVELFNRSTGMNLAIPKSMEIK
jgi:hypothetical protein